MRKIWDIPGGVHPPENKTQSNQTAIGVLPLPAYVVLPLNQHIGAQAIPTVQVGDQVLTGQKIAEAQGLVSAPVHASISGTVIAIEERAIPHASGLFAPCIVIESDGRDTWLPLAADEEYLTRDNTVLIEKIRGAGIAGMGGAGFPTAVKMRPRADQPIDTLILNGTECEPYITADDRLMRERADQIIAGALLMAKILGHVKHIIIGIEDNKPEAVAAMSSAAKGQDVEIVSFPTKYPSGGEKQLIHIVSGKEVPSGGLPAHIGIVVQNVATALAAYRAARFGEPLISRVTTVVGESLSRQGNVEVRLGTPIAHVLQHHGFDEDDCARLIIGGPMMGFAMTRHDVPVIKTTNCILVPSRDEMPEPEPAQPCIRCGMCAEACPASLLPQQLFWYAQAEDVEKLNSHNLFDCIECGACSYVCPSNIPLVQYYRASKGTIRKIESDKFKSDRSRQRFEFRQERIAKAEAEKEAKRLARKQAAEEAKIKIAAQNARGDAADTPPSTHPADIAAAAVETARQQDSAELQHAKLERALSSAQSRVERAKTQLAAEQTEVDASRVETLAARLKQAEQNCQEAQQKLDEFKGHTPGNIAEKVREKVTLSPREKQEKNIATLKKRLATAEQKFSEAEQSGAATTEALQQGVEKLRAKLVAAEHEWLAISNDAKTEEGEHAAEPSPANDATHTTAAANNATINAAEAAIVKAQAKALQLASMSEREKAQAQRDALQQRLEKARQRLADAETANSDHCDALRSGVEKLEAKLAEVEQAQ